MTSIRIPLSDAYKNANYFSFKLSLLLLVLCCLFGAQYWLNKVLLLKPLAQIRDQAVMISTKREQLGSEIPPPFGREFKELISVFNLMSVSLRQNMDQLEERIAERCGSLKSQQRAEPGNRHAEEDNW